MQWVRDLQDFYKWADSVSGEWVCKEWRGFMNLIYLLDTTPDRFTFFAWWPLIGYLWSGITETIQSISDQIVTVVKRNPLHQTTLIRENFKKFIYVFCRLIQTYSVGRCYMLHCVFKIQWYKYSLHNDLTKGNKLYWKNMGVSLITWFVPYKILSW